MANIGNLAVQLSLDAALFASGLDRATKEGAAFASTITKTFAGIGAGVAGLEAVGGGAAALYQGYKSSLDSIIEQGREAKKLGVSLEALGGINLLLGKDSEVAGRSFEHFSAHLAKAAAGSVDAMKPFRQLGLDAKSLADASFDKSLGSTLDKLNMLGAGNRNNLAKELFGREGPSIIADMEKGSQGIADAIASIKKHGGIGIDDKDVQAALEASRAITEMENSFGRIKLTLVSELAPVVKNIADWTSDTAGVAGGGLRKGFHDAAATLVEGLGKAVDVSADLFLLLHRIDKFFTFKGDSDWVAKQKKANDDFQASAQKWGLHGPTGAMDDDFEQGIEKLRKDAHSHLDMAKSGLDGVATGADVLGGSKLNSVKDFSKEIGELNLKVSGQIASFGMAGEALERYKLSQMGATAADLAGIDAGIAKLSLMKSLDEQVGRGATSVQQAADKFGRLTGAFVEGKVSLVGFAAEWSKFGKELSKTLDSDVWKVVDDLQSPIDKLKNSVQHLQMLRLASGGITGGQLSESLGKEFLSLSPFKAAEHAPGALMQGSDAAHSMEVAFSREGQYRSLEDEVKAGFKSMVEEMKTQQRVTKNVGDVIREVMVGQSIED
jgi:hypothetical protein